MTPSQFNRNLSNLPLLLSAKDVAPMLRVSVGGVYQLAKRGDIPCKHIGTRVFFPRDLFLSWLRDLDSPLA